MEATQLTDPVGVASAPARAAELAAAAQGTRATVDHDSRDWPRPGLTGLHLATVWILSAVCCAPAAANYAPVVSNVNASQNQITSVIDVYYDVVDMDGDILVVSAEASDDGGVTFDIPVTSVAGDIGYGIVSGTSKHFVWDAGMDYPGFLGPDYVVRVTACDPAASTIRVDLNGGGDYLTIREGIEAAQEGDVIVVAPGTYVGPDNRDLDFGGKNITVRSELGREDTVIDCQYEGRAFNFHSGEDESSVVQGFTITRGVAISPNLGCGINCYNSSPTIMDCTFSYAEGDICAGYGVSYSSSSASIANCEFHHNNLSGTYGGGGGIAAAYSSVVIADCSFHDNVVAFGGGVSFQDAIATVTGCSFVDNSHHGGDGRGGAISSQNSCTLTIRDCTFTDNSNGSSGGAADFYDTQVTMENCVFTGNRVIEYDNFGGALYFGQSPGSITNCTFSDNASNYGGAVCIGWDSAVTITNSIIAFSSSGEGVYCSDDDDHIVHCCIYGNAGGGTSWCDTEDTMELNPRFCDRSHGDFTLCSNSPCLPGAGNPVLIGALGEGCGPCAKK